MTAWTAPYLASYCFALALAIAIVSRKAFRDLFSPTAVFVFGYGGLYLLGMLRWALLEEEAQFDDAASFSAVGVVLLGLISFVAVARTANKAAPAIELGRRPSTSAGGATLVFIVYGLVSILAFLALIVLAGGPVEYVLNYEERRLEVLTGWALVLPLCLPAGNIGFVIWMADRLQRGAFSVATALMLGLPLAVMNAAFSRTSLAVLVLTTLVVWHYLWRPIRFRALAVIASGMLLLLSSIALYRIATSAPEVLSNDSSIDTLTLLFLGQFDAFDSLVQLISLDDQWRLQWGATIVLPLLTKPIPRIVWPDKPLATSHWLMDLLMPGWQDTGLNRAAGLLVEQYVNFSLVGVVLGMIILAWLWSRFYSNLYKSPTPISAVLLYSQHVTYLVLLIRNDANSILPQYLVSIMLTHVALAMAGASRTQKIIQRRFSWR